MSMDSNKFLCGKKEGYSKAQACLQKILSIICSVPPHQLSSEAKPPFPAHLLQLDSSSVTSSFPDKKAQTSGNGGLLFDLNMDLTSSPDYSTGKNQSNTEAVEADCSTLPLEKYEKEEILFVGEREPVSETNVEVVENEKERFGWEEGSLGLTIEAGEVSSNSSWASGNRSDRGGFGLSSEMGTREMIKGKQPEKKGRGCRSRVVDLYGRFDEVPPLVKRGRKRVLPCRYKDSELLQRLARNAGSSKRHRLR